MSINEKLLPTTASTLDQAELKRMMNLVYGTFGIPNLSTNVDDSERYPKRLGVPVEDIPTYMNDQAWMDIGRLYVIPLNDALCRDSVMRQADKMIKDAGYPDKENIRILVGIKVMSCLSKREYAIPRYINTVESITFVYDSGMRDRELRLQKKRVSMSYHEFFSCPWQGTMPGSTLRNALTEQMKDTVITATDAMRKLLKNINMEDTEMLGKSVDIKKVIFSGPCTIVIWEDGDKTMVRQQEGDTYSKEVGLLMCLAKRVWGKNESGSNFNDYMRKYISEEK